MKNVFPIYKGQIKILDNRILINDGIFKWHKILQIIYSVLFVLVGIWLASRYTINKQLYMIILGIVLMGFGILSIILGLKVNTSTTISVQQIEKAIISRDKISSLNLTLYLKNSQKRKIQLDSRDEDRFWELHIADFTNTLKELSINVETK